MATISGTIKGATLLSKSFSGADEREVWLITADFGAYTGASDDAQLTGIGAHLDASCRDGKSRTLRDACAGPAGSDTNAQDVYAALTTVATDDLTGNLAVAAGTEIPSATASEGCQVIVVVDAA